MSRSNPTEHAPHPCTRWLEWDGSNGTVRYYDKTEKKNIDLGTKFTFIVLDVLACVKGWHDSSDSGIYSNEVKDTREGVLLVKSFKGGVIAQGLYANIKDRVKAAGGHFTAMIYLGYREDPKGPLKIGSLALKGAAMAAWSEFQKTHRDAIYSKAVNIHSFTEGKKGKITFRTPNFEVKDIAEKTDHEAKALDQELQAYFKTYFARTTNDRTAEPPPHAEQGDDGGAQPGDEVPQRPKAPQRDPDLDTEEDDIPF